MAATGKWPSSRLGDLAEFRNGVNYNKSSFGQGIKVVGVADFQDYTKPRYDELQQINPEGVVSSRNILRDGDIVFVRSNGNRELIGRSLFIEQPPEEVTHSAFTIRLRFTSNEVDPKFYAYCFRTSLIRQALTAHGGGTNINNLNQDILGALHVPCPSLSVQRRIAGILSAYDDLIENCQRRIRVLGAMSCKLYREWFVHFRFPGSDKVSPVESPLGDIPEGWDVAPLSSVVHFTKGRKPPETRSEAYPGDIPVLLIDTLRGGEAKFASPTKQVLAEARDTIMVMDGASSCDVALGFSGVVGSTLGRFRTTCPDLFSPHALYRYLEAKAQEFKSKNIGAAIPHANKDYILTQLILLPPTAIASLLHAHLEPMQCGIEMLRSHVQILRRTRDLLLPRLLSGQIDLMVN